MIPEKTVHQRISIRNQHSAVHYHSPASQTAPSGGWAQDSIGANGQQAVQYLSPGQMAQPAVGYLPRNQAPNYDYQSGYNGMAPPPPPPAGRPGVFSSAEGGMQRVSDVDYSLYPTNRSVPPQPPLAPPAASFVADTYQHGAADFYIPPQPPSLLAYEQPSIFGSRNDAHPGLTGPSAQASDTMASFCKSFASCSISDYALMRVDTRSWLRGRVSDFIADCRGFMACRLWTRSPFTTTFRPGSR